jgi:hypothetical protein
MRNDSFFITVAVLTAALACGGLASARSAPSTAVAGTVARESTPVPAGSKATLELDDDKASVHARLQVGCNAAHCTFSGYVPPGVYRASIGGAFSLDGRRAVLSEALDLRKPQDGLRLIARDPVTVAGTLSEGGGCPAQLPSVTFRRASDGEEFGAAVSCSSDAQLGFAASLEPGGRYDVRVDLPDGRSATARLLTIKSDVVDLPLGMLLPSHRFSRDDG